MGKQGNESELQWIYGIHAVQSLLKSRPEQITEIKLQRDRSDQRLAKLKQLAERLSIPVKLVDRQKLEALFSPGEQINFQGVAACCHAASHYDEVFLQGLLDKVSEPLFLILDGVTDPHNLGACLRSADAAGVNGVIVPKDRSVGITPVVRKVACGAAETIPLIVVTNLVRTMKQLQQRGVWITGTAGEANQVIYQSKLTGPLALVMGAEEKGMRRLTRENCDELVSLPMAGAVSSLNVSVATGICLFEVVRQRAEQGNQPALQGNNPG